LESALAATVEPGREPASARSVEITADDWRLAASDFLAADPAAPRRVAYLQFLRDHADWLQNYVLYQTIRQFHGGKAWYEWPAAYRDRDPATLTHFAAENAPELDLLRYQQFVLDSQWQLLHRHARERHIALFGDIPIFVSHDSADVWAHRNLFQLSPDGSLSVVSGVPPDYFSSTGQRWGQPLYDWTQLAKDDYRWWINRIAVQAQRFDLLRLDHFRGFEACWAIEAGSPTAENGAWQPGPGRNLFDAIQASLGTLPCVAENLGVITPEVESLRRAAGIPGMSVLQFAFDGNPHNANLPHNHEQASATYTGTHDNDTTLGWWLQLDAPARHSVRDYFGYSMDPMPRALIRAALRSVSTLAVVPMQDLLELGSAARMNVPGKAEGNWRWRFSWTQVPETLAARLRALLLLYGRTL
jgi:4-alpha-glucanotransferase